MSFRDPFVTAIDLLRQAAQTGPRVAERAIETNRQEGIRQEQRGQQLQDMGREERNAQLAELFRLGANLDPNDPMYEDYQRAIETLMSLDITAGLEDVDSASANVGPIIGRLQRAAEEDRRSREDVIREDTQAQEDAILRLRGELDASLAEAGWAFQGSQAEYDRALTESLQDAQIRADRENMTVENALRLELQARGFEFDGREADANRGLQTFLLEHELDWRTSQGQIDREFTAEQGRLDREFTAAEGEAGRELTREELDLRAAEAERDREFAASEGQAGREFAASEGEAGRELTREELDLRAAEAERDREFAASEGEAGREFAASEGQANRELTASEGQAGREFAAAEGEAGRELSREELTLRETLAGRDELLQRELADLRISEARNDQIFTDLFAAAQNFAGAPDDDESAAGRAALEATWARLLEAHAITPSQVEVLRATANITAGRAGVEFEEVSSQVDHAQWVRTREQINTGIDAASAFTITAQDAADRGDVNTIRSLQARQQAILQNPALYTPEEIAAAEAADFDPLIEQAQGITVDRTALRALVLDEARSKVEGMEISNDVQRINVAASAENYIQTLASTFENLEDVEVFLDDEITAAQLRSIGGEHGLTRLRGIVDYNRFVRDRNEAVAALDGLAQGIGEDEIFWRETYVTQATQVGISQAVAEAVADALLLAHQNGEESITRDWAEQLARSALMGAQAQNQIASAGLQDRTDPNLRSSSGGGANLVDALKWQLDVLEENAQQAEQAMNSACTDFTGSSPACISAQAEFSRARDATLTFMQANGLPIGMTPAERDTQSFVTAIQQSGITPEQALEAYPELGPSGLMQQIFPGYVPPAPPPGSNLPTPPGAASIGSESNIPQGFNPFRGLRNLFGGGENQEGEGGR